MEAVLNIRDIGLRKFSANGTTASSRKLDGLADIQLSLTKHSTLLA